LLNKDRRLWVPIPTRENRWHARPHALMVKPPRAFLLPAQKRERGGVAGVHSTFP